MKLHISAPGFEIDSSTEARVEFRDMQGVLAHVVVIDFKDDHVIRSFCKGHSLSHQGQARAILAASDFIDAFFTSEEPAEMGEVEV